MRVKANSNNNGQNPSDKRHNHDHKVEVENMHKVPDLFYSQFRCLLGFETTILHPQTGRLFLLSWFMKKELVRYSQVRSYMNSILLKGAVVKEKHDHRIYTLYITISGIPLHLWLPEMDS